MSILCYHLQNHALQKQHFFENYFNFCIAFHKFLSTEVDIQKYWEYLLVPLYGQKISSAKIDEIPEGTILTNQIQSKSDTVH